MKPKLCTHCMWLSICIELPLLATCTFQKGIYRMCIFSYKWANLSLPCPIKGITLLWMLTGFASSFRLWTITGLLGCGCVTKLLSLLLCGLETHTIQAHSQDF